jgi:hypothetical protein
MLCRAGLAACGQKAGALLKRALALGGRAGTQRQRQRQRQHLDLQRSHLALSAVAPSNTVLQCLTAPQPRGLCRHRLGLYRSQIT